MTDNSASSASPIPVGRVMRPVIVLLLLLGAILATRLESYLLFHALAELASVVISAAVFIIAWNSARLEQNNYLLVVGLGLGFVAVLDTLHMLAFKGMSVFPPDDSLGAELWLCARFVQASAFLAAPLTLYRNIRVRWVMIFFIALTFLLLASIFWWNILPEAYSAERGLTSFKVGSEYIIIAMFLMAGILLWRERIRFDASMLYLLLGSLVAGILTEIAFTLYFGVTDTANLVGHLFKIVAFFLLYLALVEMAFTRPYDLLFRQLKKEEESQRTGRAQAEAALRDSERKYRGLVDTALVGVYQTDGNGAILFANPELARMLQFDSPSELIGKRITDLYRNPAEYSLLEDMLRKEKQIRNFETELISNHGQACSVLISALIEGETLSGMVRDVTENKRAEKEIELHIERLHALREIDLAIMGSTSVHVSLQTALDQAINHLGIDAADVLILNQQTRTLKYVVGRGFRSARMERFELHVGQGVAGRAAIEQQTQHIRDLTDPASGFTRFQMAKNEGFIEYYAIPLTAKGAVMGVLEIFSRSPLNFDTNGLDFLHALAGQAAIAIDNNNLLGSLQRANTDLLHAYDATIKGWSHALDLRDKETEGHTLRVTEMTVRLAREAGLSEEEIVNVQRGALLHDIGKMGVPDHVLLKPDQLTDEEWEIMRRHPQFAFDMLAPIAYLRPALDIPYCHHEKWDGSGYPRKLKGEQIPLAARLFAVVDVWDALCSDRPYRKRWDAQRVREHIRSLAGSHFDPKAVDLFMKALDEFQQQDRL